MFIFTQWNEDVLNAMNYFFNKCETCMILLELFKTVFIWSVFSIQAFKNVFKCYIMNKKLHLQLTRQEYMPVFMYRTSESNYMN